MCVSSMYDNFLYINGVCVSVCKCVCVCECVCVIINHTLRLTSCGLDLMQDMHINTRY